MQPDLHVAYKQYWSQRMRWENGQLTSSNSLTSTTHGTGWQQYATKSRKQNGASVASITSNGVDGQLPPALNVTVQKCTPRRHLLARLALSKAEVKAIEPSVKAVMEEMKRKSWHQTRFPRSITQFEGISIKTTTVQWLYALDLAGFSGYASLIPFVCSWIQPRRASGVLRNVLSSPAIRTYCTQSTGFSCTTEYADLWDNCCTVLWWIVARARTPRSVNPIPPKSRIGWIYERTKGIEPA